MLLWAYANIHHEWNHGETPNNDILHLSRVIFEPYLYTRTRAVAPGI